MTSRVFLIRLLFRFAQPAEELLNGLDGDALADRLVGVVAVFPLVESILRHDVFVVKNVEDVTQHSCKPTQNLIKNYQHETLNELNGKIQKIDRMILGFKGG